MYEEATYLIHIQQLCSHNEYWVWPLFIMHSSGEQDACIMHAAERGSTRLIIRHPAASRTALGSATLMEHLISSEGRTTCSEQALATDRKQAPRLFLYFPFRKALIAAQHVGTSEGSLYFDS